MAKPFEITAYTSWDTCLASTGWTCGGSGSPVGSLSAPPDGSTACYSAVSGTGFQAFLDKNYSAANKHGALSMLVYYGDLDAGITEFQGANGLLIQPDQDTTFTNWFTRTVNCVPGWNHIVMGRDELGANAKHATWGTGGGSPSWDNNFQRLRFRTGSVAASKSRTWIRDIEYGGYCKPVLLIRTDDAKETVYTNFFPIMQAYGFVGSIGVIGSKVGTAGYMSEAQIDEMYHAGWDVVNHSWTHGASPFLRTANYATCLSEIQTNEAYLLSKGWTRRNCHKHYVAPYGEFGYFNASEYRQAVIDSGVITSHGTMERLFGHLQAAHNRYHVPCIQMDIHGAATSVAEQQALIDSAVSAGAVYNPLVHEVVTGSTTSSLDITTTHAKDIFGKAFRYVEAGVMENFSWTEYYEQVAGAGGTL